MPKRQLVLKISFLLEKLRALEKWLVSEKPFAQETLLAPRG